MNNSVKYKNLYYLSHRHTYSVLAPFRPESLSLDAWLMFAIFVGTIIGQITQPMPIGAVSIIGFTLTVLVGVIDTKTAVQGFGNPSIWLIAMAFFISRGFVKLDSVVVSHFSS